VLRPKFLHALENDQVLLAYLPPGTGVLFTIFFSKGVKKSEGSKITELCHVTCHLVNMITNVQIFGGSHPENLGGQKRQNLARFGTTSSLTRMSQKPIEI